TAVSSTTKRERGSCVRVVSSLGSSPLKVLACNFLHRWQMLIDYPSLREARPVRLAASYWALRMQVCAAVPSAFWFLKVLIICKISPFSVQLGQRIEWQPIQAPC